MTELAIGYARGRAHSQDDRAVSPEEQRSACEKYAEDHGLRLTVFHVDEAEGNAFVSRPGLWTALDALARGEATSLVVADVAAFGRHHDDFVQTLHFLVHADVTLHSVADGGIKRIGRKSGETGDGVGSAGSKTTDGDG